MKTCFGHFEILFRPQLFLKRSNPFILKAARIDQGEIIQVRIYIQSKAVHGDETAAFHADRTNLTGLSQHLRIDPHACSSCEPLSCNAIESQKTDNRFLQPVDVLLEPQLPDIEIEDRISGELSGP